MAKICVEKKNNFGILDFFHFFLEQLRRGISASEYSF